MFQMLYYIISRLRWRVPARRSPKFEIEIWTMASKFEPRQIRAMHKQLFIIFITAIRSHVYCPFSIRRSGCMKTANRIARRGKQISIEVQSFILPKYIARHWELCWMFLTMNFSTHVQKWVLNGNDFCLKRCLSLLSGKFISSWNMGFSKNFKMHLRYTKFVDEKFKVHEIYWWKKRHLFLHCEAPSSNDTVYLQNTSVLTFERFERETAQSHLWPLHRRQMLERVKLFVGELKTSSPGMISRLIIDRFSSTVILNLFSPLWWWPIDDWPIFQYCHPESFQSTSQISFIVKLRISLCEPNKTKIHVKSQMTSKCKTFYLVFLTSWISHQSWKGFHD